MQQSDLFIESRLSKVEIQTQCVIDDMKEIKMMIRLLIGLVFSLNSTIIGIVTKGFGIF